MEENPVFEEGRGWEEAGCRNEALSVAEQSLSGNSAFRDEFALACAGGLLNYAQLTL